MGKKVAFKTLGCRLNQYETDALISKFSKQGYEVVDFSEEADAYVVNTCTVTNQSDHKSRNLISQAARRTDKGMVVVTGCMANAQKEQLEQQDHISYVVDNERKSSVFSLVDGHFKGEVVHPNDYAEDKFGFPLGEITKHVRSLIKIHDGCNNFCTFCIIPFVRGRATSRPVQSVLDNITQVIQKGFKEVVLTGVNIGRYEADGSSFEDLVEQILGLPGDFRVRISSIEPEGFGDKLYGLLKHPKLTPHMHICLQSGSEKVLLKMRRMYTARGFQEMMDRIKEFRPDMNLTTDIIVGFPGETEEDFLDTVNMVKEIGFSHVHTFKYSEREGTRSARMTDQVDEKVKNERSEVIRLLAEENKRAYRSSFIGQSQRILIEKVGKEYAIGHGEHFLPIRIPSENIEKNTYYDVEITGIEDGDDPNLIASTGGTT
jgi:threonylcarbamoyladenosine tRNA methylthiotransferase MtaB